MNLLSLPELPASLSQARLVRGPASMTDTVFKMLPVTRKAPSTLTKWKQGPTSLKKLAGEKSRQRIVDKLRDMGRKVFAPELRAALNCMSKSAFDEHLKYLREQGTVKCDPPANVASKHRRYWL